MEWNGMEWNGMELLNYDDLTQINFLLIFSLELPNLSKTKDQPRTN